MSFASRLNFTSAPAFRRTILLLVVLLSFSLAASSQTQKLVVTPYSVLGSQTSLGTANTANVAVDSKDNVYYPNFYSNAIYKIDTQGNQTVVPSTGLNSPQGMRFDASDNLYICDASNSRIVVLTPAGVQTVLPMTGLLQPQHLAFDAGYQNLYVSDRYAGILQYNLASQKTTVYATNLFRPGGIAVDAQNNIYYGDGGTLVKNGSAFSTTAGQPDGLLFDKTGNLYVESTDGEGLHRIDPSGTILAMADDGSNDIAVDSHGILYMPSHNGQHMFAYLPGPAIWGGRIDAFVGGRIDYHYANTIRTYYATPAGVTLSSVTIPAAGSPYGGDNAPSCFTSTLCGANMSLGAFLPGPQPGYALATFSDGTKTTTPLYGTGLQVEMGFSPGATSQITPGITYYGGLANDLNGSVYVTDRSANKVFRVTGTKVTPLAFTGLNGPTKLALDGADSVYVLDTAAQRILKLDSAGNQTVVFARQTQGILNLSVDSFAVDGATNIYLAAQLSDLSYAILRLSADGTTSTYAASHDATAMAFDTFGTLYIGDAQGNLGKFDHFANYIPVATGLTAIDVMAIEPSGTVYVSGFQNLKLRQISPAGAVTTYDIAGVKQATVVAVDNYGNLTVGDNSTQLLTFNDRTTQPYAFGDVTAGTSSTLHHSLVNVGSVNGLTLSSVSGEGQFVVDSGTTTCVPATTNLVAGGSCEVGYTFTPNTVQTYSNTGRIFIPLPTPFYSATEATLALTGNGVKAAPVANPGGPYSGTAGSPVSFNGAASTDPTNETLTYAWTFGDNTTATGATPTHTYAAAATYTVTLTITNTDGTTASATTTATIADTYTATLSPATYNFGNVGVGGSAAAVFTLTNTGTGAFQAGTIQLAADATNSYSATNNCGNGTLATGASCAITVTFHPTASGAVATTLTVKNAAGTQSSAITGTGIAPTATLTPATYDFGNVAVGASQTNVFTLTNTSPGSIAVGTIVLAPEATGSYSYTKTCGTTLAASASCTFTVTFTPTAAGSSATTLNVTDDAGRQTATITGAGIAPTATLTPATYDFGSVAAGLSQTHVFTLTNTSAVSIAVGTIVLAPEATNSYSYTKTCGTTLAAGTSCTFTVTFKPTVGGSAATTLNVTDDAGHQTSAITGAGIAPTATLTPSTYDFGSVAAGSSQTHVFTLTNTSAASIAVGTIVLAPEATNSYSYTKTCGTTLAASASCTFTVTFTPTAAGSSATTLNVTDDAGRQTATITGAGIAPTATLTPATYDFGSVAAGLSQTHVFTLTNTSAVSIAVGTIVLAPESTNSYSYTKTCGTTLAAGASCTFTVTFKPTTAGSTATTLNVTDDAGHQAATITGTGIAPTATLTPAAYHFGNVLVGASASRSFVFTNTGSIPVGNLSVSSPSTAAYAYQTTCGATVASGASCTVTVNFAPPYGGVFSTSLTVTSDAGPLTSTIDGVGAGSTLALTPSTYDFGTVPLGTTPSKTFTLTNSGTLSLPTGRVTVVSSAGAPVPAYSNSTNCPATLAAGASCSITVTFAPLTDAYAYPAILTVSTPSATLTSTLSGKGYLLSNDFTLTSNSPQGLYNPGMSFYVQAATPNGSFPYPITFTFDGFGPQGYTPYFTPPTVTPGSGIGTTALTFTNTGHAMLLLPQPSPRSRVPLPAACALFCVTFLARKRLRRKHFSLLLCLCLLAGTLGLGGCGYATGGTVYATGNGITHQYKLSFLFSS